MKIDVDTGNCKFKNIICLLLALVNIYRLNLIINSRLTFLLNDYAFVCFCLQFME